MSRRGYYRRGSYSGYDYAERHIEEANALTEELGGTDEYVKKWFFSLPVASLNKILDEYQKVYGEKPGRYAKQAFLDWKSGRRKMSGLVAERLFKLLPTLMPVEDKYNIVESLWNHLGPTTKRLVKAGCQCSQAEVIEAVIQEVRSLSTNWDVPTQMQNRFNWLAADDSVTYKKLLAHIKEQEKALGESVLKEQIPILKVKFENELAETTSRLSYIIKVGKQSVELRMTSDTKALSVGDWEPVYTNESNDSSGDGFPWLLWLIAATILFAVFGK